jgi:hypothetical protein
MNDNSQSPTPEDTFYAFTLYLEPSQQFPIPIAHTKFVSGLAEIVRNPFFLK